MTDREPLTEDERVRHIGMVLILGIMCAVFFSFSIYSVYQANEVGNYGSWVMAKINEKDAIEAGSYYYYVSYKIADTIYNGKILSNTVYDAGDSIKISFLNYDKTSIDFAVEGGIGMSEFILFGSTILLAGALTIALKWPEAFMRTGDGDVGR